MPRSRQPAGPCAVEDCQRRSRTRGFCNKHYQRFYRYGDPLYVKRHRYGERPRPACSADDCDQLAACKGMCRKHYQRTRLRSRGPRYLRGPTGRGRWDILVWFARTERIVSKEELAEMLAKIERERP
jgi:hypothetical protein